ncbi:aminotransferase class V-fold PLP-dependent enzyme [Microlunatus parietis]|uniref:Selenocysteine lyase/cysteine desulfurase n=1 Tax=Microlunatus parietis TaxID=682979 RepID=A0A7Y9LB12_9ACTN|nr:aminotransferase class V-fold PLP-dependent enzyme [Microlunatus parietis]NYE70140.1 selenocysteine lyase/cysteine desulfurase [Microlunatus parietis]
MSVVTEARTADDPRPQPAIPALRTVSGAGLAVPLVNGRTTPYVNLDYAASAPALTEVLDELGRALPYYASVHRGAGYASAASTTAYEQARRTVATATGARADDHVIFTRNTTDALNLLARAVPADLDVVCLDIEHHANLLPWQQRGATVITARPTIAETLELIATELARPEVGLLAITGASNVTGETLPLDRIADLCRRTGTRLAVDGAQLVPHRDVDLAGTGIDYLAFSGHKTYAPFGAGVLIGRPDWLDAAPPYLAGGGAVRRVRTDDAEWATGPARHEGGTPNVLGAVTLAAACRTLSGLGRLRRDRHERALTERLRAGLLDVPGVSLLRIFEDSTDTVGIVAFTVAGFDAGLVAAYLSAEHGIGVRDGKFCAHPLLNRLGCADGAIRVSVGLGSSSADIDALLAGLRRLVEDGPGWNYGDVDGRIQPVPDPRPAPDWLPELETGGAGCRG